MCDDQKDMDDEWVTLIKEAKERGLSIDDVKGFLQKNNNYELLKMEK
ncbi:anti-repressor SinI family protein [Halobacillus litoralis]|nr:anti-repressor SinI family protein [Halobacillus litoralis]